MKKFIFILVAILAVACLSQKTYAYTFTEHDNALASDSPYSITFTEEEFDSNWNKVVIKIAPQPGYNFYGAYVISIFNLFNDENLAPYDMLVQNGWIGQFPNAIPNLESAFRVELFNDENQMKQRFNIAAYQGDPDLVVVRFNFIFTATDYFKITIYVDSEVEVNGFINSILSDSSGKMIRVSSVSLEEYNRIYSEGYGDAQIEINTNYDNLISSILEYQEQIALLESQLQDNPLPGNEAVSRTEFIENNLIYIILMGVVIFALGMYAGQKKKRYKRSYR